MLSVLQHNNPSFNNLVVFSVCTVEDGKTYAAYNVFRILPRKNLYEEKGYNNFNRREKGKKERSLRLILWK